MAKQPPQHQDHQPGSEAEMTPRPRSFMEDWPGGDALAGKTAIISGGDSGIGRAVAIGFAKEGADVVILHKEEHEDAAETLRHIVEAGGRGHAIAGDIGDPQFCARAAAEAVEFLGGQVDILVNNAAEQHPCDDFAEIPVGQVDRTFRTNILGMFWLTKAVLPHMPKGSAIINSTSVTAYKGSPQLVDYASTKGAIVGFTRSLALALWEDRQIRVNGVAPGPIWTPLIPSSFGEERTSEHGSGVPLDRPGQPDEVAPCYLFLADPLRSSYMTGQVLHPNGGTVVNG